MLRYDRQTKPGLVALYDIRPGNGAGPFLQPRSPHSASAGGVIDCTSYPVYGGTGVRADERFGEPPHKVDPGAFSGQRQGWKTPRRTPLAVHCFCVCSVSVLLGDLLGVS